MRRSRGDPFHVPVAVGPEFRRGQYLLEQSVAAIGVRALPTPARQAGAPQRRQAMPPGSTPSTTPAFGPLPAATFHPRSARPRQSAPWNTTYTWSGSGLLADVQAWVSNPASNFGWVIRGNEIDAGSAKRFNTRENSTNPPQLTVTYQVSCATPTPTPTRPPTPTATPEPPTPTPTPDTGASNSNPNGNADTNARLWRHGFFGAAKRQHALRGSCRSTQQRSGHLSLRGKDRRQPLAPWIDRVRSLLDPHQCDNHRGDPFDVPVAGARGFPSGLVEQSVERLG